jgi:hypothetical protein
MSVAVLADEAGLGVMVWSKGCGVCRRTYGVPEWNALPVVALLPPASVQAHISVPASWTVELRRCACGAVLAARAGE